MCRLLFIAFACLLFAGTMSTALGCGGSAVKVGTSQAERQTIYLNPLKNCKYQFFTDVGQRIKIYCDQFVVGTSTCTKWTATINGATYCGTRRDLTIVTASNTLDFEVKGAGTGKVSCTVQAVFDPCNCGRRKQNRIVGGTTAGIHEFVSQAAITDALKIVQCGAVIIDPNYVVTAAHCVVGHSLSGWNVIVGEHDLSTELESKFRQNLTILNVIPHSQYNSATSENDIALIRTSPINFNENVGVVCLPWTLRNNNFANVDVVAAGWGSVGFGDPLSKILQKVDLMTSDCPQGSTSSMICTFKTGKDTCQHDSGTSLFYTNPTNNLLYSIGVVSNGKGCAGSTASLNTRVTSYLDWIILHASGALFCAVG